MTNIVGAICASFVFSVCIAIVCWLLIKAGTYVLPSMWEGIKEEIVSEWADIRARGFQVWAKEHWLNVTIGSLFAMSFVTMLFILLSRL